MSSSPYTTYYVNQAGSGIGGFQGARFQRGQGFFGNVFKSAIMPLLKYFGKQALSTGVDVARDALEGDNVLNSLKSRGKMAARNIAKDAVNRAERYVQTGKGRRRRRRRNNLALIKTVVKRRIRRRKGRKRGRKRGKRTKNIASIFS